MTLYTLECKSTTLECYFYVFLFMVWNSTFVKKCVFYNSFLFDAILTWCGFHGRLRLMLRTKFLQLKSTNFDVIYHLELFPVV